MNLYLIIILCIALWLTGEIRHEIRFTKMCNQLDALAQSNDEKVLEYAYHVIKSIKESTPVLTYTQWLKQ